MSAAAFAHHKPESEADRGECIVCKASPDTQRWFIGGLAVVILTYNGWLLALVTSTHDTAERTATQVEMILRNQTGDHGNPQAALQCESPRVAAIR